MNVYAEVRRRIRSLRTGMVYLEHDGQSLPPIPRLASAYTLRVMDPERPRDLREWLEVNNEAFGRRWGRMDFQRAVMENPHVEVKRTFLVHCGEEPVAMGSAAVYRRNPRIGLNHYVAVKSAHQGAGLGKHITLYRLHRLVEDEGVDGLEMETTIDRRRSILMYFGLGFLPKHRSDPWNTPDGSPFPARMLASTRAHALYARWCNGQQGHPGVDRRTTRREVVADRTE